LVQQTNWRNAERAIDNLRERGLLDLKALSSSQVGELECLIRPAGFYQQKARRIVNFSRHVSEEYGSLTQFFRKPQEELRRELLSLDGVGLETADVIMLYAAGVPVFPASAYARRIFGRLTGRRFSYNELQEFIMRGLPADAGLFGDFHALLVEHGKSRCRSKPLCNGCPLRDLCDFAFTRR